MPEGGATNFPEGILFQFIATDGVPTYIPVLTDSGAGIPCVGKPWVVAMKLPIIKGKRIAINGVTAGKIVTDEYTLLQLSLPGRTEVLMPLWLVVLPATGQWTCNLPSRPLALQFFPEGRVE